MTAAFSPTQRTDLAARYAAGASLDDLAGVYAVSTATVRRRLVEHGVTLRGSGTTMVAAQAEGVRSVGIEAEEKWCELAAKRLGQGSLFGSPLDPDEPDLLALGLRLTGAPKLADEREARIAEARGGVA